MKKAIFELIIFLIVISSMIVGVIYLHNKKQIERQAWKPLVKVDKNIPEVIKTILTLFYKSNDGACGLSVLAEVSHEDKEGMDIVDNIIVLLDKQLLKTGWYEINYTELQAKRNYALTIIHSKNGNIEISIKANNKMYRKRYDTKNSDFIVSEVFTRLFGVEV